MHNISLCQTITIRCNLYILTYTFSVICFRKPNKLTTAKRHQTTYEEDMEDDYIDHGAYEDEQTDPSINYPAARNEYQKNDYPLPPREDPKIRTPVTTNNTERPLPPIERRWVSCF